MDAKRIAALRAGPQGSEWQDVRAFVALFEDGSTLSFASKSAPAFPKDWQVTEDGIVLPHVWTTRVPQFVFLRLDKVTSISEVEVPDSGREEEDLEAGEARSAE